MALILTGLGPGDVAEAVGCLLACAEVTPDRELAAYRRRLAHLLGDALDTLAAPRRDEEQTGVAQ